MSENKADPLREALNFYADNHRRRAREALAAPQPAADSLLKAAFELSCQDQFDLATAIAANVGYVLVTEPRPNRVSIPVDLAEKVVAAQPAAPLGGREALAQIIFDKACGLSLWDNDFYAEERQGCLETADAILAIPQERGVEREAIVEECALRLDESAAYEDRHIEAIKKDPGLSETGRESLIEHAVTRRTAFRQGASSIRHLRALAGKETGR